MPVATTEATLYELTCVDECFDAVWSVGVGGRPHGAFEGSEGNELDQA